MITHDLGHNCGEILNLLGNYHLWQAKILWSTRTGLRWKYCNGDDCCPRLTEAVY